MRLFSGSKKEQNIRPYHLPIPKHREAKRVKKGDKKQG